MEAVEAGGAVFSTLTTAATLLFALSAFALASSRQFFRRVIALNMMGNAVFLFFGAVGYRNAGLRGSDPLPQAIVITAIVVAVSATALAVAIHRQRSVRGDNPAGGEP